MLFIDESGTPPPPEKAKEEPFFVLGGIIIPENIWYQMSQDIARIRRKYEISGEIKWKDFGSDKPETKPHSMSHLNEQQKNEMRTKLYSMITFYKDVRLICVETDVMKAYESPSLNNADDLYWNSYYKLISRFQDYLHELELKTARDVYGMVVCDHRPTYKSDKELRKFHDNLLRDTLEPPKTIVPMKEKVFRLRFRNFIEGLFTSPSDSSVGIQLADMVAGAVYRRIRRGDGRFFDLIREAFLTSEDGTIEEHGFLRIP